MLTMRWSLIATAILLLLAASASHAESEIAERLRVFLDGQTLPGGGEVEVTVGDPDPRLQLAPCRAYEPFIPTGARLWGRTSLGVRCTDGAHWTVYLPTQIKVFAPALVAARPLTRGQVVGPQDVQLDRVELTAYPAGVLGAGDTVEGRTTTRAIAAGEPLRRDLTRAPNVIQAGDLVRIEAGGRGFAITTEGKALATAADGQTTQVAVAGRVLTGIARTGKLIEVR